MNILSLISRNNKLFSNDIQNNLSELSDKIENGSFLILGAAGSIGRALSKQIFNQNPKKLHVVDINENNLVELASC